MTMAMTVDTMVKIVESGNCGYEGLYSSRSIISTVNVGGGDGGDNAGVCKEEYMFVNGSDVSLYSDEHGESGENGEMNVAKVSVEVLKNEDDVNVGEEGGGGVASESKGLVVANVEMESESRVVESLNGGDGSEVYDSVKGSDIEEACDLVPAVDEIEERIADNVEEVSDIKDDVEELVSVYEVDENSKNSVPDAQESTVVETHDDIAVTNIPHAPETLAEEVGSVCESVNNCNVSVNGVASRSLDDDDNSKNNCVPDAQEPTLDEAQEGTAVNTSSDVPPESSVDEVETLESSDPESDVPDVESVCETLDNIASRSLDGDDNSKTNVSDAQESTVSELQNDVAVKNTPDAPEPSKINIAAIEVTEEQHVVLPLDNGIRIPGSEAESLEDGEVIENNGGVHEVEVPVKGFESTVSLVTEPNPLETDATNQSVENSDAEAKLLNGDVMASLLLDAEDKRFLFDTAIIAEQSSLCRKQNVLAVDSEAVGCELDLDEKGDITNQIASFKPEENPDFQSVPNRPEKNSRASWADDICFEKNLDNNGTVPYPFFGNKSKIAIVNGDIDGVIKSNNIQPGTLKPVINFGSFEFVSPFLQNGINLHSAVLDKPKPTAASTSSSEGFSHDTVFTQVPRSEQSTDASTSSVEGSEAGSSERQIINPDLVRRPFYWLVKIPRIDGEKHREELRLSEAQLEERTKTRNSCQSEANKQRGFCRKLHYNLEAAKSEARAARASMNAKRRELDSAQSLINLAKSGVTVEDVDSKKFNLERRLQHETHTLNMEREIVREIRLLAHQRQQLLANPQQQQEIQQARNQRDHNEEQLKVLRKELVALRDNSATADEQVKAAQKKYDEENALLSDLTRKLNTASDIREEAFAHMKTLRQKNSASYKARNDLRVAYNYAAAGEKASLERHCVNQVGKFMEEWNNNDEFRKEYIQKNKRNMIRKFGTLDGTQLGINEAPQSLEDVSNDQVNISAEASASTEVKDSEDKSSKQEGQKNAALVATKIEVISENILAEASDKIEEEELARKAEQLRREQDAARLKEQRRLEEKEKAEEALERKRRNAAKSQEKAEFKSRKEAEQQEKKREKRAKKRERMRGLNPETTENHETVKEHEVTEEPETAKEPEVMEEPEAAKELEVTEKPVILAKRSKKPHLRRKQVKTSIAIPPVLHSKGNKRRFLRYGLYFCFVLFAVAFFFLGGFERIQTFKQHISAFLHQL